MSEGLTDLGGACMAQIGSGYLFVCTEHGLFAYDGREFVNLGPAQGLIDGGIVYDLGVSSNGRIAVRYSNMIFVSDRPIASDRPISSLSFSPVDLRGASFFAQVGHKLAAAGDGFALLVGRQAMRLVLPQTGRPFLAPMGYTGSEQAALNGPAALFSIGGHLWESFESKVCAADSGEVHCYVLPKPGAGYWTDIVAGSAGVLLARSLDRLATIDPRRGTVTLENLPDQGDSYRIYPSLLGLFLTPSGELVTQSASGLIVRTSAGWAEVTARDGLPAGVISSVLSDHGGQLWIQVHGQGLFRGLGYGHWEALQSDDGLSAGQVWECARASDGSLWVSTDTAVDQIRRVDGVLHVVRVVPSASFALATDPRGALWSTDGLNGASVIDPKSGTVVHVAMPPLDAVVADNDFVWLGTENGLFHVNERSGTSRNMIPDDVRHKSVEAVLPDGSGGVWFLANGRLRHLHATGSNDLVGGLWPSGGFEPRVMSLAPDGHLWIAGAGGLFELYIRDDRVLTMQGVTLADLGTNSVPALTIDHRGWVWAGTSRGVSVFNGHRWVSIDSNKGLLWNDVDQGGLYEDHDGSMWIATSQGLSHLLDPAWLFASSPVKVVISTATLGQKPISSGRLRYTTAPLALQFGTLSFAAERSIVFRYRMSGVDDGWAETPTGSVRYASVPPGRHVLTVIGYDTMSHTSSAPVRLVIEMDYPWWATWWAYAVYALLGVLLVSMVTRLSTQAARQRQRQLKRLVAEQTGELRHANAELERAQAELRRQATVDYLTGLLNRAEFESRLAARLQPGRADGEMLIAMVDVDHFKRINDRHGHLRGDDVIRAMAVRVSAVLRDGEFAGRYGGEEMILVLDDRDGCAADRILVFHQSVRGAPFYVRDTSIPVTCSIGIAWAAPGDDWESLVGRADEALYEAKDAGRDRIMESRAGQPPQPPAQPSNEGEAHPRRRIQ